MTFDIIRSSYNVIVILVGVMQRLKFQSSWWNELNVVLQQLIVGLFHTSAQKTGNFIAATCSTYQSFTVGIMGECCTTVSTKLPTTSPLRNYSNW